MENVLSLWVFTSASNFLNFFVIRFAFSVCVTDSVQMNNIQEHSNFLTGAAQLLNDTAVNIESQIEKSKEKGIGKQQQ